MALEGGTDSAGGEVEIVGDAGEGFPVAVAGRGEVDLRLGEVALLTDGRAGRAKNSKDAPFAKVVLGGELVCGGTIFVGSADRRALVVGKTVPQSLTGRG
ncbi:hypothetical protein [Nocardia iowensis]|uniref:Uncharacterized protein n=1 Tax=Nocardia iowensis TaxID=204891 RepID=A0ABX8RYN3_NOCIO|nr:hypothetical protein [Nocardia iowensis]QXN94779.1 hypothetical protein KV110_18045 [Nocardia iowensis]